MSWTYAARGADFAGRDVIGVACGGQRLALYRVDGRIFATRDQCPHMGAALSGGCVVDGHIECPLHFALFDIRTGASDGSMTNRSLTAYPVKVEDDVIYVDVSAVQENAP